MRILASLGFTIALISWSAGTVVAAPTPFLLPQGALPPSIGLPLSGNSLGQHPQVAAEGVLYSFYGWHGTDGEEPTSGLIGMNGALYGTTFAGGKNDAGTVFAVTSAGTERVVYSFGNGTDGTLPQAGLSDVNGVLYGTTCGGGKYDRSGTVFTVTAAGAERVLHSFGNGTDGVCPMAGLVEVNGVFYGTTAFGGKYGGEREDDGGTVFALTTADTEHVVYNFSNGNDGAVPQAGLLNVNGVLYGTTAGGGKYGGGAVFALTTAGTEHVLHAFGSGTDGRMPLADVIDVNGVFYGTTYYGGKYRAGTVFTMTAAGTERVLHSFGNGTDGVLPRAGLLDVNGVLYGTTQYGGKHGHGTIFAITTSGSERVIRDFGTCEWPEAGLTDVNGVLYGTTFAGGKYQLGTVFFQTP